MFYLVFSIEFNFSCRHVKEGSRATEVAEKTELLIEDMTELSNDQKALMSQNSLDGKIVLYSLPGKNICVPLILDNNDNKRVPFVHIFNGKVNMLH